MASLKSLIRVRRHAVEQKQKILADLYRQAEELERKKQALESGLDAEREKARDLDPRMLAWFGPYAHAVREKVKALIQALARLETRIQIAREDMREAFADAKKIEIAQEKRDAAEQAELNKKESAALDEIGLETYRRRQE